MTDPVSTRYKEALRRGHVAVVRGRPKEAVEHYQQAAELADQRPLPFVSMGTVFLQMRELQAAIDAFDQALERDPDDDEALRGKARALDAAGRSDEAAALAARLRAVEGGRPGSPPVPPRGTDARIAELERHVRNGAMARAAGDDFTSALAYLAAANGYAAINDFDAAIDACFRALEAQPGHIDVHFTMAVMYLRRGWVDLGVERVKLIDRRLDVDDDPRRRAALHALARDHRALSPELERLAAVPA